MTPLPAAAPKKMNPVLRVFLIICGLIILAGGIAKIYKGWNEMRSASGDAQFKPLLEENDKAIAEANKLSQEAQPMFQTLLDDVDKLGLDHVRAKESDTALKIDDLFGKAAEQFRIAVKTSKEASRHHTDETMKSFLVKKGESYVLFAEARDDNREIIRLILNKSILKIDDLLPKLQEAAGRRDAAQKKAMDTDAEAEAMTKKSK
jgi:hypothetical protein